MVFDGAGFLPGILIEALGVLCLIIGFAAGSPALLAAGILLVLIAIAVLIRRIVRKSGAGNPAEGPAHTGSPGTLYSDHLVTITEDAITFHHYTFPAFTGDRRVPIADIDHIDVRKTAIGTGKWRIAGSGDFATWYPMDWDRPSRDRTFLAVLKKRWGMNIGFSVEHSAEVTGILRAMGLIGSEE